MARVSPTRTVVIMQIEWDALEVLSSIQLLSTVAVFLLCAILNVGNNYEVV